MLLSAVVRRGDDALSFRLRRAPPSRYIGWNGPYLADAPRKCLGEALAMRLVIAVLDAWAERRASERKRVVS